MKAINTDYRGTRYRTKLEARWAVFMDAMGVQFKYEPNAYELNGATYIPDFWLPELRCHLEICEDTPSQEIRTKAGRMASSCDRPTFLLVGEPTVPNAATHDETRMHICIPGEGKSLNQQWWIECPTCNRAGLGRWVRDGWQCPCGSDAAGDYKSPSLLIAYARAKKFCFDLAEIEEEAPVSPQVNGHSPLNRSITPPAPPVVATTPAPKAVPLIRDLVKLTESEAIKAPIVTKPAPVPSVRPFNPRVDIQPIREKLGGRVSNEDYVSLVAHVEKHKDALQTALDEGMTVADLSAAYHMPVSTLVAVLSKRGIEEKVREADPELPLGPQVTVAMLRDTMLLLYQIGTDLGLGCGAIEDHLRTLRPK